MTRSLQRAVLALSWLSLAVRILVCAVGVDLDCNAVRHFATRGFVRWAFVRNCVPRPRATVEDELLRRRLAVHLQELGLFLNDVAFSHASAIVSMLVSAMVSITDVQKTTLRRTPSLSTSVVRKRI